MQEGETRKATLAQMRDLIPAGEEGASAYEIWLDEGFEGTEADFLDWLRGEDGQDGKGRTGRTAIRGRTDSLPIRYGLLPVMKEANRSFWLP